MTQSASQQKPQRMNTEDDNDTKTTFQKYMYIIMQMLRGDILIGRIIKLTHWYLKLSPVII